MDKLPKSTPRELSDYVELYYVGCKARREGQLEFSKAVFQYVIEEGTEHLFEYYYNRKELKELANTIASSMYQSNGVDTKLIEKHNSYSFLGKFLI